MHTPDLFLARASECESMAKIAADPASKATWNRMASRWQRCAEIEAHALSVQRDGGVNRHRKPGSSWPRH